MDMADPSPNPIPEELRQAFHDAVSAFQHWDRGGPEPDGISLWREPRTISFVCDVVERADPMPDDLYEYLRGEAESADTTSALLQGDRSYRAGAQSLYRMIQGRKAQYERTSKL